MAELSKVLNESAGMDDDQLKEMISKSYLFSRVDCSGILSASEEEEEDDEDDFEEEEEDLFDETEIEEEGYEEDFDFDEEEEEESDEEDLGTFN